MKLPFPKALLVVGVLAVTAISLVVVLPGALFGITDLAEDRLPAPPEIRLVSPADGDGVTSRVVLSGEASSSGGDVFDVQYRVDGGRWQSVPVATRGQRAVPFEATFDLGPGDHVLEARALDADATSLPARADVRRDAPTVRILQPLDGQGVEEGLLLIQGFVRGEAESVLVELAGGTAVVPVGPDGTWRATLPAPSGLQTLRAIALAEVPSLPAEARIAGGTPAPPTLAILTPGANASYGETGDLLCGASCILFTGVAPGASRVLVEVDGEPAGAAALAADRAWQFRLPMVELASGAHEAVFTPLNDAGEEGVPRELRFLARTQRSLVIHGADAVELSGTPLELSVEGERAANASWSIDGEAAARGAVVTLTFAKPGDHVLTVESPGARGRALTASATVHVLNRPPSVRLLGGPTMVDGRWQLDADAQDVDGKVVAFLWDFGDGTTLRTDVPTARHHYLVRGSYPVSVTAIDDLGAVATAGSSILIDNAPPVVAFDWTPAEPTVHDLVTLVDKSIDHDGRLVERKWTFDDGNTSANETPTIRFRTRGPHEVSLRVVDDLGTASLLKQIVNVANLPPVASFRFEPIVALTHQEVLFADTTLDPDGTIRSWRWDFGDNGTAAQGNTIHIFRAPGLHNVTLTVTDDAGANSTTSREILVVDSAPEVRTVLLEPAEPVAQQEVRLRVVAVDRDGDIVAATWDFGDGTTSNETEPLHRFPTSGAFLGNVTVYDEAGLRASFPFHVKVGNALPYAELAIAGPPVAAYPVVFGANAMDPGGRITFYRFDIDGDGLMECETTEGRCEAVYERPGVYGAKLVVEDDEGASAETTLLVDVASPPSDHPPPRVNVEAPAARTVLRGDHLFRGSTGGVRDVLRVDLQMRQAEWAYSGSREPWRLASGTSDWTALVDTRSFHDGDYDLVVRATDAAGGVGFARIPVSVANGPRPSDVYLRLVDAPTVIDEDVGIRGSAFHPEGVTVVRWRIDHDDWHTETENALAFTVEVDRDRLKPGEHVLQVEAYHGVLEKATSEHVFTVPGVKPVLVVDVPPNAVAHALVHAEGRIVGEGRAQFRIDQGLWTDLAPGAAWVLDEDTLDVRSGEHTVHLRAVSPDRRLFSDVASYRITVVNPPFPEAPDAVAEPPQVDVPSVPVFVLLALVALVAVLRRR